MQQNSISILSTRPLNDLLIKEAKQLNIEIDVLSFIETETVHSSEIKQEIEPALLQSSTVVFTSMNAVEIVAKELAGPQPDWKIYCIGNTTIQLVKKYFGKASLAGTANSAAELAELIADDANNRKIIFFCGDHRRSELPDILRNSDINVKEIVVYRTVLIHHKIEKKYHGILFFSPSAVKSFFSNNHVAKETILFAIGNTTAMTLQNGSHNKVIISEEPGKEKLVRKMMEYFETVMSNGEKTNTDHSSI